jgi:hypothetical protein
MCGLEGCSKHGKSECKSIEGKLYCTMKHLRADNAVRSEEAKVKTVSSEICYLLFLFDLPCQLNTALFLLSFFSLYPTEAEERQAPSTIPSYLQRNPRHFWRQSRILPLGILQEELALTPTSRIMRSEVSLKVW